MESGKVNFTGSAGFASLRMSSISLLKSMPFRAFATTFDDLLMLLLLLLFLLLLMF